MEKYGVVALQELHGVVADRERLHNDMPYYLLFGSIGANPAVGCVLLSISSKHCGDG